MKNLILTSTLVVGLIANLWGQANCGSPVALAVGTTQCGTNSNAGSFPDGGGAPTNPCNGSYNDGEYWFSVTGTGAPLSLAMTGLSASWSGLYVLSACPGSSPACVASFSSSSTTNYTVNTPALTAGQVYYIVVANWSTPYSTNFCLTSSVLTPPANDDPCNATPITAGAGCTFATYTNANASATSGVPAPGCSSYTGGDVWFSITVPASGSINFDSNTGVITDGGMAIYSGTCAALTLVACDDDASANGLMPYISLTGQTPGATLWVRFWEYGNNNNGTFQLCATDPGGGGGGGAPANDDPCSATALTVNASCVYTGSTNAGATTSAGVPAPGCASYSGGDVWFTVTVPATGNINFNSNTGVITDGGMAIYSGTCGALSLILCDDDGSTNGLMPAISLTGQPPGATLWVRFWEYGNDNNGTFSICASEGAATGPCGSTYNDNCANPAILTQGTGSFTGNTSTTFTADLPGNITSEFCGSIENNSWFIFTASATTETFNFSSVSNCSWGDGVQAEAYSFTTDVNGCCTAFSSVSNCWNPASATSGTLTASGLTIGNSYLLMVDGWAGDDCEFTISGWSSSGILPVSLTSFYGTPGIDENYIYWTTKSELNNSHFILERSIDGISFHKIGLVYGADNSNSEINYSFTDRNIDFGGLIYYRLKQVDYDGSEVSHGIVSVNNASENIIIFPNPSESELSITIGQGEFNSVTIEYLDAYGRIVSESANLQNGVAMTTLFSDLCSGIYFVRILDGSGNLIHVQKVVRK